MAPYDESNIRHADPYQIGLSFNQCINMIWKRYNPTLNHEIEFILKRTSFNICNLSQI